MMAENVRVALVRGIDDLALDLGRLEQRLVIDEVKGV